MLDAKSSGLKFSIESGKAEMGVTHNSLIEPLKSFPVHFRDAQPCHEFVAAHVPSSLTYVVPEGMRRFSAIGYNSVSHHVKFQVWANVKAIYKSPQAGIVPVDVKLPQGTKTIELKIDDLGDLDNDTSFGCYPRLYRK